MLNGGREGGEEALSRCDGEKVENYQVAARRSACCGYQVGVGVIEIGLGRRLAHDSAILRFERGAIRGFLIDDNGFGVQGVGETMQLSITQVFRTGENHAESISNVKLQHIGV